MIGLVLKDFYSLRSYLIRQLGLMCVIYLFIGFSMKNFSFLSPMLMLMITMSLVSSFAVDESAHWDSYALTLPLEKRQIVLAKYIFFFGTMLATGILASGISCLLDSFTFHAGADAIFLSTTVVFLLYTVISSITLPLYFKFGVEKARLYMTFVYMLPFFGFVVGAQYLGNSGFSLPTEAQIVSWCIIGLLVGAITCVISYGVSLKLYETKEF